MIQHCTLDGRKFFGFAIQMVQGIQCLHNCKPEPIMHRDIKSMNFLVTENWCVKLCDFGLARFTSTSRKSTFHKMRGTGLYIAPEVCEGNECTTKSDMYSLTICLWEMIHRCITGKYQSPFAEYPEFHQSMLIVLQTPKGLRPTIPIQCPSALVNLINLCWGKDISTRPDCEKLLDQLLTIQNMVNSASSDDSKPWLGSEFRESSGNIPLQIDSMALLQRVESNNSVLGLPP